MALCIGAQQADSMAARTMSCVVIAACWLATVDATIKLSELVTPCSLKDPNLNECLLTLGTKMLPATIAGFKEWDVVPLEPLQIPSIKLQSGGAGASVGLTITMTNSTHYGRSGIQLKSVKCNPKTLEFEVTTHMTKYAVVGMYEASGRVLLLPITGHGSANLTFIDINVKYNFKAKLEHKGKKTHILLEEFTTVFDVGKLVVKFENLFGNKQLSDTMNTFLNDNSNQVFADLKPTIEDLMTDIDKTIFSRMLAKIPVNQLLQDYE